MNETQIVRTALERLRHHADIKATWKPGIPKLDGELFIMLANRRVRFYAEVKNELRQYHLPELTALAKKYQPLMVIAENIFPTLKKILRERNINYLDTAGNIYIRTKQDHIFIDGNKAATGKKPVTNRAFTKTGLKTVFYLLFRPETLNMPYRHLAYATDVALGNIKNVMEGLNQAGFILQIDENTSILKNKKALFDRWLTGYREILKPTLMIDRYRFWNPDNLKNWQRLKFEQGENSWGGEPAAEHLTNYLVPQHLTVYTTRKSPLVTNWKLIPDEEGDVLIYTKFWRDAVQDTKQFAPTLLVYADLLLTDDPRCLETAKKIYEKYLQHEFE